MKLRVFGAVAKAALSAGVRWLFSPVAWRYERPFLLALGGAVIEAVRAALGHA